MKRTSGFTLLELLLVAAVIALLAGLLLPAISRLRRRVQAVVCLNRLKQWSFATHIYANDNDDFLPPEGSSNGRSLRRAWYVVLPRLLGLKPYSEMPWRTNALAPLRQSAWICPANTNRSNGYNLFHYCLNGRVDGVGTNDHPVRLTWLKHPDRVVWLFDNGRRAAVAQQNNVHTNLHQNGAQFTFLDAHAAHFKNTAYWDFKRNRGRLDNPDLIWSPSN